MVPLKLEMLEGLREDQILDYLRCREFIRGLENTHKKLVQALDKKDLVEFGRLRNIMLKKLGA